MGKSTLRDRRIVEDWLRNNRLFIKSKDSFDGLEDLKLAELEASLEYCLMWKRHISEMYEAVYAESQFIKDVRYFYKKSIMPVFADNSPDSIEVDFWEHQERKREIEASKESSGVFSVYDPQLKYRHFNVSINRRLFRFNPSEKHLDVLMRMDEINKLSKQAVKMLSTLKEQISERKAIALLENKRRMEELEKEERKRRELNDNKEDRLSPEECGSLNG